MEKELKKHFSRTLEFGKLCNFIIFPDNRTVTVTDLKEKIDKWVKINDFSENSLELKLKEIFSIELNKEKLCDSEISIREIFELEKKLIRDRERILVFNFDRIKFLRFSKNKFIYTYRSNWCWSPDEERLQRSLLISILSEEQGENYFLFRRTGTYDDLIGSNVLEVQLNKFQYYMLELFEGAKTPYEVCSKFYKIFEINSIAEENLLFNLSKELIRELFFRGFIVRKYDS